MKKTAISIVLLGLILILFAQCKKDDTIYSVYFYTSIDTNNARLSLYIDDENKGNLPYMPIKPAFDNDTLMQKALLIALDAGTYKMLAKDEAGSVKSEQTVKIRSNSKSVRGSIGASELFESNNSIIIGLFY